MSQSGKYISTIFLCLTLVSCSRPKTIHADELRSHLMAAISLASETELFINQLQERRFTSAFAEGHARYLSKEASRLADELRHASADGRIKSALEIGRTQLNSLEIMLAELEKKTGDRESLSAERQQATKIGMILEHTKNEL
jgi:hypothetical protein